MPRNYPRVEVRLSRDINHRLELLALEAQERLGKKVTKSQVVREIVGKFFEKDRTAIAIPYDGSM